jgi:hypothetical protein
MSMATTLLLAGLLALLIAGGLHAITHTINLNWQSGGGGFISKSVTLTGIEENNRDQSVAASTTNLLVPLAFVVADLQSIYIFSDQDLTLKTNSSGSPQETITLKANKPLAWYKDCGLPVPFAGDVTALYVTNAGATLANFSLRALGN